MNPPDKIDLELTRFFLALKKALDIPQLLPYTRRQIFDNTEKYFNEISDSEVREYLSSKR